MFNNISRKHGIFILYHNSCLICKFAKTWVFKNIPAKYCCGHSEILMCEYYALVYPLSFKLHCVAYIRTAIAIVY